MAARNNIFQCEKTEETATGGNEDFKFEETIDTINEAALNLSHFESSKAKQHEATGKIALNRSKSETKMLSPNCMYFIDFTCSVLDTQ